MTVENSKAAGIQQYFRFSPVVDGEDQGIGLFHVVDDLDIPAARKAALLKKFDEHLPFPPYDGMKPGTRTEAYFTEKGMEFFGPDIKKLIHQIEGHSIFKVRTKILSDTDGPQIIYRDEYQVLVLC